MNVQTDAQNAAATFKDYTNSLLELSSNLILTRFSNKPICEFDAFVCAYSHVNSNKQFCSSTYSSGLAVCFEMAWPLCNSVTKLKNITCHPLVSALISQQSSH